MFASFGRYLDIDLTSGRAKDFEVPLAWQEQHLGGRGIAARILFHELTGRESPYSADNILVFATGPLQGTGMAGAGRHVVMGLSPKTGSVMGSYVGGYFGHELGQSGYDGLILRGASAEPVTVVLVDGKLTIESANHLWGKNTGETEEWLKKSFPGSRIASIGVAGEKLVQMACIIHDRSRSAGRPGFGAVMGSKRLKAIVIRGNSGKTLYDPDRFGKERVAYAKSLLSESNKRFGKYGTASVVLAYQHMGILPTKNFKEGVFDGAELISGERLHDTILVSRESCSNCPIRCKRIVKTAFRGREVLPEFGGPEYETVVAFGSLCLNEDLNAIALANQLCNDYGIDTISAGIAIAFLMEASEKGLIDDDIPWGDGEAIVKLIRQIALREGIGDRVAQGLAAFAEELGADFDMTIKGVEVPMHDPRGKKGLGLSYATSPRGATHLEGIHDHILETENPTPELGITQGFDRFVLSEKVSAVKTYEDLWSFTNSLILCLFTINPVGAGYSFPEIRSLLEAATGLALSPEEMLKIGERNYVLLRLHAARAGYTREADGLPSRFLEPLSYGGSAGHSIDREEMKTAIDRYYELRGYDSSGPTKETLHSLGLEGLTSQIGGS